MATRALIAQRDWEYKLSAVSVYLIKHRVRRSGDGSADSNADPGGGLRWRAEVEKLEKRREISDI